MKRLPSIRDLWSGIRRNKEHSHVSPLLFFNLRAMPRPPENHSWNLDSSTSRSVHIVPFDLMHPENKSQAHHQVLLSDYSTRVFWENLEGSSQSTRSMDRELETVPLAWKRGWLKLPVIEKEETAAEPTCTSKVELVTDMWVSLWAKSWPPLISQGPGQEHKWRLTYPMSKYF